MDKRKKTLVSFSLLVIAIMAICFVVMGANQLFANQSTEESIELLRINEEIKDNLENTDENVINTRKGLVLAAEGEIATLSGEKAIIKGKMMNAKYLYDAVTGKVIHKVQEITTDGRTSEGYYKEETELALDYKNNQGFSKTYYEENSGIPREFIDVTSGPVSLAIDNYPEGEIQKMITPAYVNAGEITLNTRAFSLLNPQQLAAWLDDINEWDVVSETQCFNRPAYIVEGAFKSDTWARENRDKFKIVVDQATGIVFEYEMTNQYGEVTSYEKFEEISIVDKNSEGSYSIVTRNMLQEALENLQVTNLKDYVNGNSSK